MSLDFRTILVSLASILTGCWASHPSRPEEPISTAPPSATISLSDVDLVIPRPTVFYGSLTGGRVDVFARPLPAPQSACVVEPRLVFERIPDYVRIRTLGLDDGDPQYWLLLAHANETFHRALRKTIKAVSSHASLKADGFSFDARAKAANSTLSPP